jgi:hypothetical protein
MTSPTTTGNPTASPTAPSNGAPPPKPAAPPNPKIQAVTFALELAKIRAAAGVAGEKITEVTQLLSDAGEIAKFIGSATAASMPPRQSPIPAADDAGGSMVRMATKGP